MWGCEFYIPVFLNLFISTDPRFVVQQLSQLINSDHVVVSVFINFQQTQMGILLCTIQLLIILMLIGTVFEIIWDIFHGRISLNFVLLLLQLNFVNRSILELIYLSLIVYISSNFIDRHDFQLVALLQYLLEISLLFFTNKINRLCL